MNKIALRGIGLLLAPLTLFSLSGCGTYNRLVTLEQNVNKKWADVQSVYQRRADLIPNLVQTVQGAANFEKSTLTEVTNARASVGQVKLDPNKAPTDAAELEKFQQAQGQLSTALSRLLVVSENYPQLRATESFQALQAQLEGTENRISVERNNFNAAVQEYNTALEQFPTNMLNKMFSFKPRPFFTAQTGAEKAPSVKFDFGSSPAATAAPAGTP
jgi:LemA protein